jgi:hypothetical protein
LIKKHPILGAFIKKIRLRYSEKNFSDYSPVHRLKCHLPFLGVPLQAFQTEQTSRPSRNMEQKFFLCAALGFLPEVPQRL